jgi:predicted transcriptional regulator
MLKTLITSKTRLKLLLKFFLNKNTRSYLRNLENEFGESSNAIRIELNRLETAGLLITEVSGNKKYFQANSQHPLFSDIHNILRKTIGVDKIVEQVMAHVGDVKEAYLLGDLAIGKDSEIIDLLLIGESIDRSYVLQLVEKVEKHIDRKVRFLILEEDEKDKYLTDNQSLLISRA